MSFFQLKIQSKQIIKGIIVEISADDTQKQFLLNHNITLGTIFYLEYSSKISKLVNLVIYNKKISLRKSDFNNIEWIRLN